MLLSGVVTGLPGVEEEIAVGADDVVGKVGRTGVEEETRTGKNLWRGLQIVNLPPSGPLQKGGEAVVVLEVLLHSGV